ncbi:MAG: glycoside hydrolase family 15 protein [Bacillota bacterium]
MQLLEQAWRTIDEKHLYYGVVGNGETAALIGPDAAVRWLCLPRFDGTPFFASALDPVRGGQLSLVIERAGGGMPGAARVDQEYVGRTNVLATRLEGDGVRLEVVDSMPWGGKSLVRRIAIANTGDAPETLRLRVRIEPVRSAHWSFQVGEKTVALPAGAGESAQLTPRRVVLVEEKSAALAAGWVFGAGAGDVRDEGPEATALLDVAPGEERRIVLLISYGVDAAEAEAHWVRAAAELEAAPPGDPEGLERDLRFWRDWLAGARFPQGVPPELEEAYARGLLALKLLIHEQSGAILAAATASFPATAGGTDNWDYRYCWLRDGYYTARTLDAAGLHREARAFYEFALRCQGPDGRWRQPLYTLDGGEPKELIAEDLAGPGGERPIRFGNAAYDQLQIDSEPSILHGLWLHAQATGDREWFAARWDNIRRAAEAMMQLWHQPENGIWEIRERRDHWVYGKVLCAAGFRAAAALARWLGHETDAQRWEAEAETVAQQVIANGWCEERGAYLQTYDKNSPLDISALALVLWDLLPADDPRIQSTMAVFERPLRRPDEVLTGGPAEDGSAAPSGHAPAGEPARTAARRQPTTDDPYWGLHHLKGGLNMHGAFARYDYAAAPFYLPTLWMARCYLRAGRRDRAEELVRLCLRSATNLGLMAEHFDPRTGRQWGNFPQAFSHEEMVLTILELAQQA